MMKEYQMPAIEVMLIEVEDVVTTSPGNVGGNGTQTPDDEFE